jgi:ankyrin repeat protein
VQGGDFGNALQAAAFQAHDRIAQQLLKRGADANMQFHSRAMTRLSSGCSRRGADIDAQGGGFSNTLQAASYQGHHQIVRRLFTKGVDVHTEGMRLGSALQAAAYQGQDQNVQQWLEKGADVGVQGGYYRNTLRELYTRAMTRSLSGCSRRERYNPNETAN